MQSWWGSGGMPKLNLSSQLRTWLIIYPRARSTNPCPISPPPALPQPSTNVPFGAIQTQEQVGGPNNTYCHQHQHSVLPPPVPSTSAALGDTCPPANIDRTITASFQAQFTFTRWIKVHRNLWQQYEVSLPEQTHCASMGLSWNKRKNVLASGGLLGANVPRGCSSPMGCNGHHIVITAWGVRVG